MSTEELIDEIIWDRRYVVPPDNLDSPYETLLVKDPTIKDRNLYAFQKKRAFEKAIQEGVPTEEELLLSAKESDYWTQEDELIYKNADEDIQFLKSEKKRQKIKSRIRRYEEQIQAAEEKRKEVTAKRLELLTNSAEYYAHQASIYYLLKNSILDEDGDLLWPDEEAFLFDQDNYPILVVFLAKQILNGGIKDTAEYRKVARSPEWRIIWVSAKENLQSIFNRPISDLSMRQTLLIYWSRVYDSVYEDPDRPSQEIIDDDDRLDDWLANRDDRKSEEKKKSSKKLNHGKDIGDHQERIQVFDGEYIETCTCGALKERGIGLGESRRHDNSCPYGTWRSYSPEEKRELAERFYGRNNPKIRQTLNKEMEKVADRGITEEHKLRDQKTRLTYGYKPNIIPVNRR